MPPMLTLLLVNMCAADLLRRTEEKREERVKERIESYYRR